MQDLTFVLSEDRSAAEVWEVLGAAGITMQAACAYPRLDGRVVHVALEDDDVEKGRRALSDAGLPALDQRPVLMARLEPKAGELGRLARRIADTGAKIYILYMGTDNRAVVGADDLDAVRGAI